MYIRAPGPRRLWCACRVCVTSVAKTPGVSLEEVARGKQQPQATMWRHQKIESEILQLEREAELTAAREAQRILQRKKEKKEKRDRKKEESEKESEASSDVEAGQLRFDIFVVVASALLTQSICYNLCRHSQTKIESSRQFVRRRRTQSNANRG